MKGPTGGFNLNRPADQISLIEVIDAIDGLDVFSRCGIGFKQCNDDHPCPIHDEYKAVRNRIRELFESKTLLELANDVKRGESIVSLNKTEV
jgi:DNA-binding IscR family transcriptional regulator